MGKNSNPADAFRKAQRKKELNKNKATRKNARDFALVKKDTWDLQDEIERLEAAGKPDDHDKARLLELKAELEKINKKKAEWVEEHPEHRRLVYRPRKETDTSKLEQEMILAKPRRNLFLPNGLPRHPERSIYFDPVMNPYGAAPPGMPYKERDLLSGEIDSDAEPEDDQDITMPEGPPPNGEDPVASDEDIPMPDGPLPGRYVPPFPSSRHMPPVASSLQPMPGIFPRSSMLPPPPSIFSQGFPHPGFTAGTPQPPPGFFSRAHAPDSIQDIQGHISQPLPSSHPSLPSKPKSISSSQVLSATVSAEPQLRDLKKEATSFVPASLKKKKPTIMVASDRINPAPGLSTSDEESAVTAPRPNLLTALQDQFTPGPTIASGPTPVILTPAEKTKDDYAQFVEEMGDILGNN